jgi:hypothetical protein
MKRSFSTALTASLTTLVLLCSTMAPVVDAARAGGGGARAGGGASRPIDNSARDARANNVRRSSANSVTSRSRSVDRNVSRDVDVDVDVDDGCCHNGWDDDYHPVAAAAVIAGTAAVIGSMVSTPPPNCVPVSYGGIVYQQCGSTWYQPQGNQFVVVGAPY